MFANNVALVLQKLVHFKEKKKKKKKDQKITFT